ncbi:MAG: DUF6282 family protein [Desulfomonilaceae bacterium]|nr:DUF6282 family protein [Desulfomonilaceae bacterium]
MWEQVNDLMVGACDLHIHAGPDIPPRRQDILEVARDAAEVGMKALAIKDHNTITADRASLVRSVLGDGVLVLGSIVLNHSVGGFNAEAVEKALDMGSRIVFMPSMDAALTIEKVRVTGETPWLLPFVKRKNPQDGLTVLNEWPNGDRVIPEVLEILRLIAERDAILDTCHLSARECMYLIDAAKEAGVKRIIVTHPNCSVNLMTIDEQKELAAKGAFLSYAFLTCMPLFDRQHPAEIAEMMTAVGEERCLLFSDFGQVVNPPPVEGYKMFLASLLAVGLKPEAIRKAASENPARLLGLT